MVRRVATVEVTSPDGTKSLWLVALPHSEAVAAVRMVISPDHIAELSSAVWLSAKKSWTAFARVRSVKEKP